jgi:hypothetical protein
MRTIARIAVAFGVLLATTWTMAGEGNAAAAFERLKQLAGEWEGTAAGEPAVVTYRVTSAGHTVIETLLPGTPHEMVTAYHLDGKSLMLTHYCAAGNQPRMKADLGKYPDSLHFVFAGATNMKSPKDEHMHEVTLYFLDANHVRSQWVSYKNGSRGETVEFDLTRNAGK